MEQVNGEERGIRDLLGQGRWRKARDEAKPLCKADRARYLPLLIEANIGLAREMLQKGLVSDARQVIAYLKTIAPREAWQALDTEIALRSGNYSAVAIASMESLSRSGSTISEAQRWRIADQLVVAFQPVAESDFAMGAKAAELAAVHKALEAVAAEQYDWAAECLRPVPHDSMFRHWKLFVKGLVAFHRADGERASRFLAEVPQDTVPGRASLPYLFWLGKTDGRARLQDMPDHALEMLARLADASGAARLLVRAERLWQQRQPKEMYGLLRKGLEPFPSEGQDWIGVLSEFCMHCLFVLPVTARDEYGAFLDELDHGRRAKSAREIKMLLRVLCLDCASDPESMYLQAQWERFIQLRERLDGANRHVSSLAYEWLGAVLSAVPDADSPAFYEAPDHRSRIVDARGAIRALQKSVQLNPDNLSAQILLVRAYDRLKQKGERNRLLDAMTRRFPDNKQVLLLAGSRCIDRKSYAKGLKYLEQALEHDRLDPAVPDAIATGTILYALEHFRRGRPAEGRQMLERLRVFLTERPDDFVRSRWAMALRRGILEQLYGDESAAEELLAEARGGSPCTEAFLFFGHLLWKRYERQGTKPDPYAGQFRDALRVRASAAHAVTLARILNFWRGRAGAPPVNAAEALLRDYLRAAVRFPFTRSEVLALIETVHPEGPFAGTVSHFVKVILKRDPKDPLLRLYEYRSNLAPFEPPPVCREILNAILKEAVRRKDEVAIQAVRKALDALELPGPPPIGPFYDDKDDLEIMPDSDELAKSLSDFTSSLNPSELEVLEEMKEFLKHASERDIRELRKSRPKGMPEEMFEMFLNSVRMGAMEPELPPKPESRPAPRQRKSQQANPNQGALFDL